MIKRLMVTTALLIACLVSSLSPQKSVADTFEGYGYGGEAVADASDDGRFILSRSGTFFGVHDRLAGTWTNLQINDPIDRLRMSGDGRFVVFATGEKLTPTDDDMLSDVYRKDVASGLVELFTPGMPGLSFTSIGDIDRNGGHVTVSGGPASVSRTTAFVTDGTNLRILGSALGPQNNSSAGGISDDGAVALFASDVARQDTGEMDLYVENVPDGTVEQVNLTSSGAEPVKYFFNKGGFWALSGDGTGVVMVTAGSPRVLTHDLVTDLTADVTALDGVALNVSGLVSMDRTGDVVSYIDLTDAMTPPSIFAPSTPTRSLQLFTWRDGVATQQSARLPALANGAVGTGLIFANASGVAFSTTATNLGASTFSSSQVVVRTFGSVAPPPPVPPPPVPPPPVPPGVALPASASAFTPRTPVRILDTRIGLGWPARAPQSGTTMRVPIRGHAGVPSDASTVALQVTAAEGTGIGFVGVAPTGTAPGLTSTLNLDSVGEVIANMAIIPIGEDGAVNVYTQAPTHVIIDLVGWWTPTGSAISAGRYVGVDPSRIIDTRPSSRVGFSGPKPSAASTTVIQITGKGGVPATGVTAVAVNITMAEPEAAGFVQAGSMADLVPGAASTINATSPGQVVAGASIVPVDPLGRIAIYAQSSTHLIVDVSGWFTDASASVSTSGLLVPFARVERLLDTRPPGIGYFGSKPLAGDRISTPASGSALVGNLTVTETTGPGFVQIGPSRTLVAGSTSTVNPTQRAETVANAFIIQVADGVDVYTTNNAHLIIDAGGYFTV
jgi:hypothetical protein